MTETVTNNIARLPQNETALRIDLAAAFRLAAKFGWHESVANHFSASVSGDGKTFLLNPRWRHFTEIKASDLLLLNAEDQSTMQRNDAPDPSAWSIHGAVHHKVPRARVLLHCHAPYATALCTLKDPSIKPIDQNTAKYFNRVSIDLGFSGLADDTEEGQRIAAAIGDDNVLLMGNHGVSVLGETVADAFEELYYFERAAKTMIMAYNTGQPLNIMSDELAEKTAQGWQDFTRGMARCHFDALKRMLDQQSPDYKD